MPVEAKPLFRPDVLRSQLRDFTIGAQLEPAQSRLTRWAEMIQSGQADKLKEREILPDFMTDLFVGLLGYEPPPGKDGRYTFSREQHVEVEGQWADASLGRFSRAVKRPWF